MATTTTYAYVETSRCRYKGRRCDQPRALKSDGTLHRYCHTHRLRFNQYQRDSVQRRRARGAQARRVQHALHKPIAKALCPKDVVDSSQDAIEPMPFLWPQHDSQSGLEDMELFDIDDLFNDLAVDEDKLP